jgi:hypothetical protein
MFKLKLHSIAQVVLYAVKNGIIHVQSPAAAALPEYWNGIPNVAHQSLT